MLISHTYKVQARVMGMSLVLIESDQEVTLNHQNRTQDRTNLNVMLQIRNRDHPSPLQSSIVVTKTVFFSEILCI